MNNSMTTDVLSALLCRMHAFAAMLLSAFATPLQRALPWQGENTRTKEPSNAARCLPAWRVRIKGNVCKFFYKQ